jgi:hypothetical protein
MTLFCIKLRLLEIGCEFTQGIVSVISSLSTCFTKNTVVVLAKDFSYVMWNASCRSFKRLDS